MSMETEFKKNEYVLVTGANGFLGEFLLKNSLQSQSQTKLKYLGVVRKEWQGLLLESEEVCYRYIDSIDERTNWDEIFSSVAVRAVIHMAAKVHGGECLASRDQKKIEKFKQKTLPEYLQVNVQATEHLAKAALRHGVKQFIFISSIKVAGEGSEGQTTILKEEDTAVPAEGDVYGQSKLLAEEALYRLSQSKMKILILRPTLIYGPKAKANFLSLLRALDTKLPLPLAAFAEVRRSFLYVGNIVDFLEHALIRVGVERWPNFSRYYINDGKDLSWQELLSALGATSTLFYVPPWLLKLMLRCIGRETMYWRFANSLCASNEKIEKEWNWRPAFDSRQAMKISRDDYLKSKNTIGLCKRCFDLFFALVALALVALPMILVCLLVKVTDPGGPVIHWSKRVGRNNRYFNMPKIRTMKVHTPQLPTHIMNQQGAKNYLTPIGGILRKLSIDEIPQLWSVLVGDMSFVGPRPALYNQLDLIQFRQKNGIAKLRPGITGWAQINGRDEISNEKKVELDYYYLQKRSFIFDLKIILLTGIRVLLQKGVAH
ncbi:MAG: sugar transferase [Oligoflexia bacterium]|nr:sugar transferase [Oligoflexia bacterium]